jgi:protein SCO1/2
MTPRAKIALLSAIALASLFVLGGALAMLARGDASDDSYRGSSPPPGLTLAEFSLRSYTGARVSRASVRGKVVALTFLESKCQEACPIIAAELARGIDLLTADERKRVAAIAISTHPVDDTPMNVRAFLQKPRAAGRLEYLVGTEAELRPVWKRFAVLSALDSGNADTHSASVRIFAPDGSWVSTLHPGVDLSPVSFAHDVRLALDGA